MQAHVYAPYENKDFAQIDQAMNTKVRIRK